MQNCGPARRSQDSEQEDSQPTFFSILKPASRLFKISGSNQIQRKCRRPRAPEKRKGMSGTFKGGGNGRGGGFHTPVRGTMFVRDGAVTPGPSRECDITFFVKGRPKSARQSRDSTVAARRVQSVTVPSSRVSRECRSPGLRSPPPLKMPGYEKMSQSENVENADTKTALFRKRAEYGFGEHGFKRRAQ